MSAGRSPSSVVPCPSILKEMVPRGRADAPLLRLENVQVEDLGHCGREAAERLAQALAGGVPFVPDRSRKRFYEVRTGDERFYIHVLNGGRKVLLLLKWVAPETKDEGRRTKDGQADAGPLDLRPIPFP